jgi:MFS superfamily sulfate permease-like transporter
MKSSTEARDGGTSRADLFAGFLVFLIALPLSLGISMASGFPPIAGILTAIVGGILTPLLGGARLTIKGPAAGLIVIVLGAVTELGQGDMATGYRRAIAVGVVAGVLQIALALARAGALGHVMPPAVIHGMLAAIGVIIVSKQTHTVLGVKPEAKEPLHLLAEIPHSVAHLNPEILVIGLVSLVLLFGLPRVPYKPLRRVPAPMVVLLAAVPLGFAFDLQHEHVYSLAGHEYHVGPGSLIRLPGSLLAALQAPDFSVITSPTSIKYIVMFALVGTIESLLSVGAVDAMDPERRTSDLDRDLLATGVANTLVAAIGGLPMISEIVRSRANIDAGARSGKANLFHGAFLLASVALIPVVLEQIPLAALGAMLIFTGTRLASPKEFAHALEIGRGQLAVFVTTCLVTLLTDLLVGVAAGLVLEVALHWPSGAPLSSVLRTRVTTERRGDGELVLRVEGAALFTGFLALRKHLVGVDDAVRRVVVDFERAVVIDHTVLEKLAAVSRSWSSRELAIIGLERHEPASKHPMAARRLRAPRGDRS